jgi:hypothetical protein
MMLMRFLACDMRATRDAIHLNTTPTFVYQFFNATQLDSQPRPASHRDASSRIATHRISPPRNASFVLSISPRLSAAPCFATQLPAAHRVSMQRNVFQK